MVEMWKNVKGYEKLYQVSNLGRVRSKTHTRKNGKRDNQICVSKGKLLKPGKDSRGYMIVVLSKEGKTKSCRVHRLVAECFIDNPNNYPIINHKDENKANNNINNLEWCTYKYNNEYGTKLMKISQGNSKKVNQYDKNLNFIKQWDSMIEAEKYLNKKKASVGISACCKNKIKTAHGYIWRYADGTALQEN